MRKATVKELEVLKKAKAILDDIVAEEIDTPSNMNVHRLARSFLEAVIEGHGNKKVFYENPEESSDVHEVYYVLNPTPEESTLNFIREMGPGTLDEYENEKVAILG